MTGAEKTLKWFNDYVEKHKVYPLINAVKEQLEIAVEQEIAMVQENKNNKFIILNNKVEEWFNDSLTTLEIHEYLGMTVDEYATYLGDKKRRSE